MVLAVIVLVLRRRVRPSCDTRRREDSMREGRAGHVFSFFLRSRAVLVSFPGSRGVLRATPVTFCVLGLPLGAAELP